jgi:GNAT superfamily N-acetyltransferase
MPAAAPSPVIRPIVDGERPELGRIVAERWGAPIVTSRDRVHDVASLPCLLAVNPQGGSWLGVAGYSIAGTECELVLLDAFERYGGVGTALLWAVIAEARRVNCARLWLVTTNDNLDALRFYQRRGMRLIRVWPDATTRARAKLKPEIPLIGDYGIPLRDELELEMALHRGDE